MSSVALLDTKQSGHSQATRSEDGAGVEAAGAAGAGVGAETTGVGATAAGTAGAAGAAGLEAPKSEEDVEVPNPEGAEDPEAAGAEDPPNPNENAPEAGFAGANADKFETSCFSTGLASEAPSLGVPQHPHLSFCKN